MNGTQFVDTALVSLDDRAVPAHRDRLGQTKATLQKEAARLKRISDFLYTVAAILPEDSTVLTPKAHDTLMQLMMDVRR